MYKDVMRCEAVFYGAKLYVALRTAPIRSTIGTQCRTLICGERVFQTCGRLTLRSSLFLINELAYKYAKERKETIKSTAEKNRKESNKTENYSKTTKQRGIRNIELSGQNYMFVLVTRFSGQPGTSYRKFRIGFSIIGNVDFISLRLAANCVAVDCKRRLGP